MAVETVFTGSDAQLRTTIARLEDANKRLEQKIKDVGKASKQAGKDAEEGFGGKALGSLKNYALGFVSIGAAVGTATAALRAMREERERLAAVMRESEGGIAGLGVEREFSDLRKLAVEAMRAGVTEKPGEAADFIGQLEDARALEERGVFFEAARRRMGGLKTPGEAGQMALDLNSIMQAMGVAETGGFKEMMGKTIEATDISGAGWSEFVQMIEKLASPAALLGISDEELQGASALVLREAGSAKKGAGRMGGLIEALAAADPAGQLAQEQAELEQLRKRAKTNREARDELRAVEAAPATFAAQLVAAGFGDFKGKSLGASVGILDQLGKAGFGKQVSQMVGGDAGLQAILALSRPGALADATAAVGGAAGGRFDEAVGRLAGETDLQAVLERRKAMAGETMAKLEGATASQLADAAAADIQANLSSEIMRWFQRMAIGTERLMPGGDVAFLRGLEKTGGRGGSVENETLIQIRDLLQRIDAKTGGGPQDKALAPVGEAVGGPHG